MKGGWRRSGHLNPTVEEEIVEREDEDGDYDGDERTLVDEVIEKVVEATDDEYSGEEKEDAFGVKRKRTIRVIIRSRAFL